MARGASTYIMSASNPTLAARSIVNDCVLNNGPLPLPPLSPDVAAVGTTVVGSSSLNYARPLTNDILISHLMSFIYESCSGRGDLGGICRL